MKLKNIRKEREGIAGVVVIAIITVVIVLIIAAVAVAMMSGKDNPFVYIPPDPDPNTDILGYVTATVKVTLDNSAVFGGMSVQFQDGSLKGVLQAGQTGGADMFKGFDIYGHDKSGYVNFQIVNPQYGYDTGKMKSSWASHVGPAGGGGLFGDNTPSKVTFDVNLPNGPAVKHHGFYQLTAWLYDEGGSLQDTISMNIDL